MGWADLYGGCKHGLGHTATGSWARDVYGRVFAEQEHARQRALLQDQLSTGGLRAYLWTAVSVGDVCSCYKQSTNQADRKCSSCHGVIDGYIPGYKKFGYNTLWMAGGDSTVTLTNTEITTLWKSSKIQLTSTATSGTIESVDFAFTRSAIGSVWEYDVDSFVRDAANSSVVVEWSDDSGSTWYPIADLVTTNPSSGTVRFRATLTRTSTGVISPLFSILRARYATIGLAGQDLDGNYREGPWILVLRQPPFVTPEKSEYGDRPLEGSIPLWTAGLGFFDPSITVGSEDELIRKQGTLIEMIDGTLAGNRYAVESVQLSDPFGEFTVQNFKIRRADPVEPYAGIW